MSVKLLKAGKHTCLGAMDFAAPQESDTETALERPGMLVYVGKFDSMDGPVEITEEKIDRLVRSHSSFTEHVKRLTGLGEIPVHMAPPLQVDHSPSAMMTVGRVVGKLFKGVYKHPVHGDVVALFSDRIRVLGKENVERVKDGRWGTVSIGADLESGKFNELSITPFPAAEGATLLRQKRLASYRGVEYELEPVENGVYNIYIVKDGQRSKVADHAGSAEEVEREAHRWIDHEKSEEDEGMHDKLKKHLMEHRKMSEKEAEELAGKMASHHMKHMGMDDEKMGKHLAAADDKELKRMSDEYDAHMKHLSEEEEKKKGDKLSKAKTEFVRLARVIGTQAKQVTSELSVAAVGSRLAGLRAAGKLTPAEIKNIDVAKLASMSDEAREAAMAALEVLEPRVRFGTVAGTTKAEAIEKVASKYRLQRMELESRMNMPSKRAEAEKRMAQLAEEEKKEKAQVAAAHADDGDVSKGMLHKMTFEHLEGMLSDEKQHGELKKHLKHLVDHYRASEGAEGREGDEKKMSALAKSHADLQNRFNELVNAVAPALGVTSEELKG